MIYQFETLKNKNCNNFTSNNKINVYHFSLNTYNSRKLRQTIREMIIVSQSSCEPPPRPVHMLLMEKFHSLKTQMEKVHAYGQEWVFPYTIFI